MSEQTERNRKTLEHLIAWIAQSSTSPISISDATRLLEMLNGPEKQK
ncbi:hypothetical protein [Roseibium sp.]